MYICNMKLPNILICGPTSVKKNYCFNRWLDNVMNFTYPFFSIRLFDNTNDHGENSYHLNNYYNKNYSEKNKFKIINSLVLNNIENPNQLSLIEKMCLSHNDCRNYALQNNYPFILHLETDVFPQKDIIEKLLFEKKSVIGAVYYTDEGIYRKPMIQHKIYKSSRNITSMNFLHNEDAYFINGEVKPVASVGLGCVLISNKVLQKIPFRFEKGRDYHPDTYFSQDCHINNISIYSHTECIASHENKSWGIYGLDYN